MRTLSLLVTICFLAAAGLAVHDTIASVGYGTIDPVLRYAWSANAGWIDFGATYGNVRVADSGLTGYAWSQVYGWILLNPTNGGVQNDGAGNLSGYAWGQNTGWINFSGVTVSASGRFSGQAFSTTTGTITFSCQQCAVATDWRPVATRPVIWVGGGNTAPAPTIVSPAQTAAPGAVPVPTPLQTPSGQYLFPRNLMRGDRGEDVRRLQIYLNGHGAPVATRGLGSPGSETRYYGAATFNAVRKFQEAHPDVILAPLHRIRGTGYFGAATRSYVNAHP